MIGNGNVPSALLDDPDVLFADGFEGALVGYVERCGQPMIPAYDVGKCLEILQDRDGMTWEEAGEYFDVNVMGAWVGDRTPAWLTTLSQGS